MTSVNILLACIGGGVTVLVVVGMFLLTPGGTEHVHGPLEHPAVSPEPEAVDVDAPRSAPTPARRIA